MGYYLSFRSYQLVIGGVSRHRPRWLLSTSPHLPLWTPKGTERYRHAGEMRGGVRKGTGALTARLSRRNASRICVTNVSHAAANEEIFWTRFQVFFLNACLYRGGKQNTGPVVWVDSRYRNQRNRHTSPRPV